MRVKKLTEGYIPPQDINTEEVVLGSLLLVRDAYDTVSEIISQDVFYKETHSLIYEAISSLKSRREPADILTVTNELKKMGKLDTIGGPFVITQLTAKVASGANIEMHCRILLEKYARRELIRQSIELNKYAYDESVDIFDVLRHADSSTQAINDKLTGSDALSSYADIVDNTVEVIERISSGAEKLSGIPTSNPKLDDITGGWQKTDLIILAARPGMGKSTRALAMAKIALINKKSVAMFSLEMGAGQLVQKQLNESVEIPIRDLRTGNVNRLDVERIKAAANELKKYNFHLIEKSAINLNFLSSTCRRIKKKHGLDLIIVDYLQLMKSNDIGKGRNRENEVSEISSGLKSIAKDLDVPIIALSQLSRQVEQRADKRPSLSDLRESGSIEQDADMVLFLYRPSYYNNDADSDPDYKGEGLSPDEYAMLSELIIAKHRNGDTGLMIKENFKGAVSRFWTDTPPSKMQPNEEAPF